MDRRKRKLITSILLVMVLAAAGVIIWKSDWIQTRCNSRQFCEAVRGLKSQPEGTSISLSSLTSFSWDRVYSFDPYTSTEEMEQILGFSDPNLTETVNEGMEQLFFVENRQVVAGICGYRENLGFSVNLGEWEADRPYRSVRAEQDQFTLSFDSSGNPQLIFEGEVFEGEILRVYESGRAVISVDEESAIASSGERVEISVPKEMTLKVGDRVRVTYDGMVMEISPLQLGGQMKVELIGGNTDIDIGGQASETNEAVEHTQTSKVYYLKAEEMSALPEIILYKDDQTFSLSYDVMSSYRAVGTYEQTGTEIILKTEDGDDQYIFEVLKDGTLKFRQKNSSDIHEIWDEVEDGAEFVPDKT